MLDFIRGVVRPTVTWLGFGSIVAMLFVGIAIPDWYQAMIALLLGYWFGHRGQGGNGGGQ